VTAIAPLGTIDTATPNYAWQDVGNADEYHLLVWDRVVGAWVHNAKHQTTDICSGGTCAVNPSVDIEFSQNHFWRVRARNINGWSDWSVQFTFHYPDVLPGPITPIGPLGTTDEAIPEYTWQDLGNAVEYQVLVYDRTVGQWIHNERHLASDICDGELCVIQPGVSVGPSNNHNWRVRAFNSAGWTDWSERFVFGYSAQGGQ